MKRNDYINIQAPMISDLNLVGKNELLLFAMIHGYTKDGKSTCRVSLSHMVNWLKTSKSAVLRTLKDLEDAGYINRHKYLEGKVECVEYTTNYEELLERAAKGEYISLQSAKKARGLKMRPASECTQEGGSQSETGLILITKGSHFDNETGLILGPNNNNIINYNNFYSSSIEQQEQEKRDFYNEFFFRNAADPAAEVERFIAYNDSHGWCQQNGMTFETPEKRLGLAKLWNFRQEGQWAREDYLNAVKAIVKAAGKKGIEGVEAIINHKVVLTWDGRQTRWLWSVTPEAKGWIQQNSAMVQSCLAPVVGNYRVTWNSIKS